MVVGAPGPTLELGPFAIRTVRSAKHGNQVHYQLDRPSARGLPLRAWFARHEMTAAELKRADEYDRTVGEVLLNALGDACSVQSLRSTAAPQDEGRGLEL